MGLHSQQGNETQSTGELVFGNVILEYEQTNRPMGQNVQKQTWVHVEIWYMTNVVSQITGETINFLRDSAGATAATGKKDKTGPIAHTTQKNKL